MKQANVKFGIVVAALLAACGANAVCRVEWPVDTVQRFELTKAILDANPKATVTNVEIAAPGLATISFKDGKARSQKVALAYEFRTLDCVGDDAKAMDEVLRNPLLFRVLSYEPMPSTAK